MTTGIADKRAGGAAAGRPAADTAADGPEDAARSAGLRYVTDAAPGIARRKTDAGFLYALPDGRAVTDEGELARIRALAVPPAWTSVWICPRADGHLQATGRDARGRKQYRYHKRWREVRDEAKYGRLTSFARALPAIRARIEQDLAAPGLPREKVVALVVRLLETTLIRVGNEEYARDNGSFGLTTMRGEHATIAGPDVRFRFRGKSGKVRATGIRDRRLARIVRRCRDLPGQELFQYIGDDGEARAVGSSDVNDYLRETSGGDFTAKDFRTWVATVLASAALRDAPLFETQAEARAQIARAIEGVAEQLGNTPAVCRKCYVHPAVLESYTDGSMQELTASARSNGHHAAGALDGDEAWVLRLLGRRAEQDAAGTTLTETLARSRTRLRRKRAAAA